MTTTPNFFRYLATSLLIIALAGVGHAQQNALSTNTNGFQFFFGTFGSNLQTQTLTVTSSPAGVVPVTVSSNVTWLSATLSGTNGTSGTTPATLLVVANPSDKSITGPGVYYGVLTLQSSSASSTQVPFFFTVNAPNVGVTSTPQLLQFQYTTGQSLPPAQTLTINASAPTQYTVTRDQPWIQIGAGNLTGQTPGAITIGIDPTQGGVQPGGFYQGSVKIQPSNGLAPLIVPVIFTFTGNPQLIAAPLSVTFNYQIGAPANNTAKSVFLTTGGSSINYTTTANGFVNGFQWLFANPVQGSAPATLSVTVNPVGLPPGQYPGTITISAPAAANPTQTVNVTLNVSASPLLDLSNPNLNFSFQVGGAPPAAQTITPFSTTPGLPYGVTTSTNGTGPWLSVQPLSGVTPAPVTVTVNPAGLPPGPYNGTIMFNAPGAVNNPQTVNVTLTVSSTPTVTVAPSALQFNFEVAGTNNSGPQTVNVTSGGTPLSFALTASQNNTTNNVTWLLGPGQTQFTTPASFNVSVSPTGLTPSVGGAQPPYTGTLALTVPGNPVPVNVPVTLNVSPAGTPLLNPSPLALTLNAVQGTLNPPTTTVTVTTTGEPLAYTTSVDKPWLFAGQANGVPAGASASSFVVGVSPASLPLGISTGNVTIIPANGTPPIVIPVTLNLTQGNLTVSTTTLSFTQAAGGPAPQPQSVNLSSTGTPLAFTAFAAGASWLTVSPPGGTTPAPLSIGVNAAGLQASTTPYVGTINIVAPGAGNSPQTITVNLTVTPSQTLTLNSNSLTFSSQVGAPSPVSQTVSLTATNGSVPFTAAAAVTTPAGGTWLSVNPPSGTASATATNLTVSVNPASITTPGTYNGTVTITAPTASNSPQTINVTYVVNAIPTPVPGTVLNAFTLQPGAVAPGEILSILQGTNLGPATGVVAAPGANGFFAPVLSETSVTFDGIPGIVIYTSAVQVNVIVPYGIAGRAQTRMVVTYKNTPSTALVLDVAPTAPGILPNFAARGTGGVPITQAGAYNADGTLNSPSNPAIRGTEIAMFGTGEGTVTPAAADGQIISGDASNPVRKPVAAVSVTVGGLPAEVKYAGSAPTIVTGLLQFNIVIPDGAPSLPNVPVEITIGNNKSPVGIATIAIQ